MEICVFAPESLTPKAEGMTRYKTFSSRNRASVLDNFFLRNRRFHEAVATLGTCAKVFSTALRSLVEIGVARLSQVGNAHEAYAQESSHTNRDSE